MEKHYLNEQVEDPQDADMQDEIAGMASNDPMNPLNNIPDNSTNYQELNDMAANDPHMIDPQGTAHSYNNQDMDDDSLREGGYSEE
jgi:hypothetical protein